MFAQFLFILFVFIQGCLCYNNGVQISPLMGWNTWCTEELCETDICNENEIKEVAKALQETGLYDAGYKQINLDDCWAGHSRSENGTIQYDSKRFPNGMKYLSNYLHNLGFKLGLYTSAGNTTCATGLRPYSIVGSNGHYIEDANTFAQWGIDYVKMDWCGKSGLYNGRLQHSEFSEALNNTGRPIWFEICRDYGYPPPSYLVNISNSWRVWYDDHIDHWYSTYQAIEKVGNQTYLDMPYTYAYMDFLMTGGRGCINFNQLTNMSLISSHCPGQTDLEYKTEFSIWSITSSPLIFATDVRNFTNIMKQVLLNKEIINVNQDYKVNAGKRILIYDCDKYIKNACQVWTKLLSNGTLALILYNAGEQLIDKTHTIVAPFDKLGINGWNDNTQVNARDLWLHQDLGTFQGSYQADVEMHGVNFVILTPKNQTLLARYTIH